MKKPANSSGFLSSLPASGGTGISLPPPPGGGTSFGLSPPPAATSSQVCLRLRNALLTRLHGIAVRLTSSGWYEYKGRLELYFRSFGPRDGITWAHLAKSLQERACTTVSLWLSETKAVCRRIQFGYQTAKDDVKICQRCKFTLAAGTEGIAIAYDAKRLSFLLYEYNGQVPAQCTCPEHENGHLVWIHSYKHVFWVRRNHGLAALFNWRDC